MSDQQQPVNLTTLYEVLTFLAPPLELIDGLEAQAERMDIPPRTVEFLDRWKRIRSNGPMLEIDEFVMPEGDGVTL